MTEDERPNWNRAVDARLEAMDLATLRLVLLIVKEHHELLGSWITATELRARLKRPGL